MLILLGLYELDRKYAFSYCAHVSCSDYPMVPNDRRFPNGSCPRPITSKPHIYGRAPAICFPDRLCHSQTWVICLMRSSRTLFFSRSRTKALHHRPSLSLSPHSPLTFSSRPFRSSREGFPSAATYSTFNMYTFLIAYMQRLKSTGLQPGKRFRTLYLSSLIMYFTAVCISIETFAEFCDLEAMSCFGKEACLGAAA
jgi:hypothetical protein